MNDWTILPLGECAVLVQLEPVIRKDVHQRILHLNRQVARAPFPGLVETVPAYNSLAVFYDPQQVPATHTTRQEYVQHHLKQLLVQPPAPQLQEPPRRLTLPVCYDPVFGTDLAQLEAELQLPAAEIVRLHSSRTYHVFLLGFTPGFPYMGILPPELHCRRKTTASQTVAAGSVAIAGTQTGIYPLSSPGGWNIIGRTPVSLVNPDQPSPFLLQPGDEVKFTPISREEFEAYENHVPA